MKKLYFMAAVLFAANAAAQTTVDFEDLTLNGPQTYWNGDDETGDFTSATDYVFGNSYDTTYNYWSSGFSISNQDDDSLIGLAGLYSSYAGGGFAGSDNYLIGQNGAEIEITGAGLLPTSIQITNNNYAAHSMLNGDTYGKVFGDSVDAAGAIDNTNGEDWFLLEIRGYDASGFIDSTLFYLADYRFMDNTQDYVVKDWTQVDLDFTTGAYTKLSFHLTSSDANSWGLNTPAFFAIDNIELASAVSIEDVTTEQLSVYPNPTADLINISTETNDGNIIITNLQGQTVLNQMITSTDTQIDVRNYSTGLYQISIVTNGTVTSKKFQKI